MRRDTTHRAPRHCNTVLPLAAGKSSGERSAESPTCGVTQMCLPPQRDSSQRFPQGGTRLPYALIATAESVSTVAACQLCPHTTLCHALRNHRKRKQRYRRAAGRCLHTSFFMKANRAPPLDFVLRGGVENRLLSSADESGRAPAAHHGSADSDTTAADAPSALADVVSTHHMPFEEVAPPTPQPVP